MKKFKNSLEMILAGISYGQRGFIDDIKVYGDLYKVEEHRYVSYKNRMSKEQKRDFIEQNIRDFTPNNYAEAERVTGNIISFSHVEKKKEYKLLKALTEHRFSSKHWDRWMVFSNGTILNPYETQKFLELVNANSMPEKDDIDISLDEIPF